MSRNGLRGTIPSELLGLLSLLRNSLGGSLTLLLRLTSLRGMDLSHDTLRGMLQGSISPLESLEVLEMSVNSQNIIGD